MTKYCMENEKKFCCFCYLFNHSCLPNIGYEDLEMTKHIAIRDINIGDELTIDYQYFSTENSFYTGGKKIFCSYTGRPAFSTGGRLIFKCRNLCFLLSNNLV